VLDGFDLDPGDRTDAKSGPYLRFPSVGIPLESARSVNLNLDDPHVRNGSAQVVELDTHEPTFASWFHNR